MTKPEQEEPAPIPPFVTPEACDHEGDQPCSRCCPCRECGLIRARG